jgi:glycosyltransferase involved in cell wall biosynthesis
VFGFIIVMQDNVHLMSITQDKTKGLILGIDASNIRAGGGLTHIRELIAAAAPDQYGFDRVIVWSGKKTLDQLPNVPCLDKRHVSILDGHQMGRILWQRFTLPRLAAQSCSLLFVPGGNFTGNNVPFVALSQNLLPFDAIERRRFGLSGTRFRYYLLRCSQSSTFKNADGMMFLTETARRYVEAEIGHLDSPVVVVPHGISDEFRRKPVCQASAGDFSSRNPFRWLYVSIINLYKHQWNVVEAVANLRDEGCHMALDLVGPAQSAALSRLETTMNKRDPQHCFVRYHGAIPHHELPQYFHGADGFIFASSCENMPIILLEAMSAGLPMASSDRGPMPEVLRDAGVYFDPEDISSIMNALRELYFDHRKRQQMAARAFEIAGSFTWKRCADETFAFLSKIAQINQQRTP